MIATAPGKLILTGEYAVLDGAPALVIAIDRRAIARRMPAKQSTPYSSPFLLAVARELATRLGDDHPAARVALEIAVDSSAFYDGAQKLGLGSSAAVTVAATALALASADAASVASGSSAGAGVSSGAGPSGANSSGAGSSGAGSSGASGTRLDRALVLDVAIAAHANAQGTRGARGSGADIAAAVSGGTIVFMMNAATSVRASDDAMGTSDDAVHASEASDKPPPRTSVERRRWPIGVTLIPFFTGVSADTATLVDRVNAARAANRDAVDAALAAIAAASHATCNALKAPPEMAGPALIAALRLASSATDRLAIATGVELVPACISSARKAMQSLNGTAKTTGAGGGDVGVAVIPATADVTLARGLLIEAGCQTLQLSVDDTGVDTRPEPK
jgi:phosphomevalonate kinase